MLGIVAVLAVVLIGGGLVSALPSLVEGGTASRAMVVAQPNPVVFPGPQTNAGYDVSFPQCQTYLPSPTDGFAIIGVHGGRPGKDQPCFPEQAWWAQQFDGFAVYVNTEYDGVSDPVSVGQLTAEDAIARMERQYLPVGTPVWLDVETDNYWRGSRDQHVLLLESAANRFAERGYPVGVYSAPRLWRTITGGVDPGTPIWLAIGKNTRAKAEQACQTSGFGGRRPSMVQWVAPLEDGTLLDHNLICPGIDPTGLLHPGE
jgi:hypothetical protein